MNIREIIRETEAEELVALSQFFVGRSDDENAKGEMSMQAFINMAQKAGINATPELVQQLAQSGQIPQLASASDDKVSFKSKNEVGPETMSQDHAKMTLQNAAKRAANKRK